LFIIIILKRKYNHTKRTAVRPKTVIVAKRLVTCKPTATHENSRRINASAVKFDN